MNILEIKNLTIKIKDKLILKNINLTIKEKEILFLIGSNGTGKSSLLNAIMGNKKINIINGKILFNNKNIINLKINERVKLGLFLTMQEPIEISGITNLDFIKFFMKNYYKINYSDKEIEFEIQKNIEMIGIEKKKLYRDFNKNFSGGEKKKNEFLQMLMFKPKFSLLDEIDSGLDINTIKIFFSIIKNMIFKKNIGFLIITHNYKLLLNYIKPNYIYIIKNKTLFKKKFI